MRVFMIPQINDLSFDHWFLPEKNVEKDQCMQVEQNWDYINSCLNNCSLIDSNLLRILLDHSNEMITISTDCEPVYKQLSELLIRLLQDPNQTEDWVALGDAFLCLLNKNRFNLEIVHACYNILFLISSQFTNGIVEEEKASANCWKIKGDCEKYFGDIKHKAKDYKGAIRDFQQSHASYWHHFRQLLRGPKNLKTFFELGRNYGALEELSISLNDCIHHYNSQMSLNPLQLPYETFNINYSLVREKFQKAEISGPSPQTFEELGLALCQLAESLLETDYRHCSSTCYEQGLLIPELSWPQLELRYPFNSSDFDWVLSIVRSNTRIFEKIPQKYWNASHWKSRLHFGDILAEICIVQKDIDAARSAYQSNMECIKSIPDDIKKNIENTLQLTALNAQIFSEDNSHVAVKYLQPVLKDRFVENFLKECQSLPILSRWNTLNVALLDLSNHFAYSLNIHELGKVVNKALEYMEIYFDKEFRGFSMAECQKSLSHLYDIITLAYPPYHKIRELFALFFKNEKFEEIKIETISSLLSLVENESINETEITPFITLLRVMMKSILYCRNNNWGLEDMQIMSELKDEDLMQTFKLHIKRLENHPKALKVHPFALSTLIDQDLHLEKNQSLLVKNKEIIEKNNTLFPELTARKGNPHSLKTLHS